MKVLSGHCGSRYPMTRTINFSSINEAVNQGFVVAARKEYQSYKGCSIYGHDNSQRGFIGASYGLRVEIPEDFTSNFLGVRSDKIFGHTVSAMGFGREGPIHPCL
jgi:hypothetical protein